MATPISLSDVRLMKGVPLRPDYEHTRWFTSKSSQTNYFLNRPYVYRSNTNNYVVKHKTVKINRHYDTLLDANYMMFQNEEYNDKWFYAFVTDIEYISRGATYVYFEIDVMQTWQFDINFKTSFIEREHQHLRVNGRPALNTIDEGLDYGTEYDIVESRRYAPYGDTFFLVVICKEAMHSTGDKDWSGQVLASRNGMPQPLTYYLHPIRIGRNQYQPDVYIGDEGVPLAQPLEFLQRLMEIEGAVNNVVSIYITEYDGLDADFSIRDGGRRSITYNPDEVERANIADDVDQIDTLCIKNVSSYRRYTTNIGDKYRGFTPVEEAKLHFYPYRVISLVDYQGNQVDLRPEYIPYDSDGNTFLRVMGSLGLSAKTAYYIDGYGRAGGNQTERDDVALEKALIKSQPQDISVINDYLTAMIQGNRNSMQNQANQFAFNGLMGGISGITSSAGASTMAKMNPGMAGVGVGQGLTQSATALGNAQYNIEGIQAKIKDADNVPPNMQKMGSNTAFDLGNGISGCYVVKKEIKPEYRAKLSDYFKMYGYKTHRVKLPNLRTRQSWNYVKTVDCNIEGDFNANDLDKIKAIFDNGITLWHTGDIGNYNLSNGVR